MNNKIDLVKLATMNNKLNLEILRAAEKKVQELKKYGIQMDPEYKASGPFESKKPFFLQSTED